jgi:hypothetical protein
MFFRLTTLNFNHVIISKDFHNVFAYYGRSKHKEFKDQKNYILGTYLSKTIVCHIVIPFYWNRFVNHVKNLIIIRSQMGQNKIK